MFWLFSVVQAPPSPSQRASTPRCQQAPSQTWRTLLPATSTSRRRGSSGRRCPSRTSSLGRPSQLGELEKFDCEKLVGRATELTSHMHQRSVSGAPLAHHCCPLYVAQCCLLLTTVTHCSSLLATCDTWDTDYISDNWEQQYQHLHCDPWIKSDGDSIRNSCDV